MEDVGILPNSFLASLWDNKKGARNSPVNFIDRIDDELSEIYDTELFTPKYVVNDDGQPVLKNGMPEFSEQRRKNFAYSTLPESFLSAVLHPIEPTQLSDTGISKVVIGSEEYYVRSLYWWRFETISGDILGKAYETYLARERKKLGIYYTPHQMTEYITKKTISQVFDDKISELKSELSKQNWNKEKIKQIAERLKEIRICDPSCGSGSFLIQAVRVVWEKYGELADMLSKLDKQHMEIKSTLDDYFTEKVAIIRYLMISFRVNHARERIGTMILRHIFGNDKDIKAADTAKLNIWLECIKLDPNSYRRDALKGKRQVLPDLELNITNGDSLVGLSVDDTSHALEPFKDTIRPIFKLRELYTESFDKTSMAREAVRLRNGLQSFVTDAFAQKYGKEFGNEILKILEPTHWPLQHFDAFYYNDATMKPLKEQGFDVIIGNPPWEILKPNIIEFFAPLYNSEE
jgi:hypothetical protein